MMGASKKLKLVGGPKDGGITYSCPLPDFLAYQEKTSSGWIVHTYRHVGNTDTYLYEQPHNTAQWIDPE